MKKLSTSAKTTEVDFVSDNVVMFYNQHAALADDAFLKSIIGEITDESDKITEAIKTDRVLSEMEGVDALVGNNLRALKNIVKGYAAMPDEVMSASGKVVLQVINKFKLALLQKSYLEQSSNIDAMLMDLSADMLKAHIARLPMVDVAIGNLSALLSLVNGKLIVYLTSAVMMDPGKYGSYVAALEKVIEDTNQNISQRAGSTNKGNNEENPQ